MNLGNFTRKRECLVLQANTCSGEVNSVFWSRQFKDKELLNVQQLLPTQQKIYETYWLMVQKSGEKTS